MSDSPALAFLRDFPSRRSTTRSDGSGLMLPEAEFMGLGARFDSRTPGSCIFRLGDDDIDSNSDTQEQLPRLECLSTAEDKADFDVLLIHGLSGDHTSTWKCGSVFWPQSLAEQYPNARVFLFAYDFRIWTQIDFESVQRTADDLLRLLFKARRSHGTSRPLVWIAHSIGGYLAKSAYVRSRKEEVEKMLPDELEPDDIRKATVGLIFFGTSHKTESINGWRAMLARVYSVAREYADNFGTLNFPTSREDGFLDILSSFDSAMDNTGLPIFSFYEKNESFTVGLPILVTSAESALFYQNETRMSLEGNHVTMCRFQSVKSPGYIAVVSAIDRITISKSATISSQLLDIPVIPSSKMEEDIQDIFKLKLGNAKVPTEEDETATRVPGSVVEGFAPTVKLRRLERLLGAHSPRFQELGDISNRMIRVKWVLKTTSFVDWYKSGYMLVVEGPIGSGKSVVASKIVRYLESESRTQLISPSSQTLILYYFHSNLAGEHSTFLKMLYRFLHQILEIAPHLARHFPTEKVFLSKKRWPEWNLEESVRHQKRHDQSYETANTDTHRWEGHEEPDLSLFSTQDLVEILLSILNDDQVGKAIFVIDGMDESPDYSRVELENFFDMLQNIPTKTKVCITSTAPWELYSDQFTLDITSQNDFRDNMRSFSEECLAKSRKYSLPQEFLRILFPLPYQSYHSMSLAYNVLKTLKEKSQISSFVKTVTQPGKEKPGQLIQEAAIYRMYRWIWKYYKSDAEPGLSTCLKMLTIVSLAIGPLTAAQLNAFVTSISSRSKHSDNLQGQHSLVLPSTKETTEHIDDNKAKQIVNKSLFGLLQYSNGFIVVAHPSVKAFVIQNLERAGKRSYWEQQMATSCIHFLSGLSNKEKAVTYDSYSQTHSSPVRWYGYALRNWHQHARRAGKDIEALRPILQKLWRDVQVHQVILEFSGHALPRTRNLPLSCALAALDLPELLNSVLTDSTTVTIPSPTLSLEQRCAAANLADSSLEELVRLGYQLDIEDEQGKNISDYLSWAHSNNPFQRARNGVPLSEGDLWARYLPAENNGAPTNTKVSDTDRLLSRIKSFMSSKLSSSATNNLLVLSARLGAVSVVRHILASDATSCDTVDDFDPKSSSVLHIAAALGSIALVEILVKYGARKSVQNQDGLKPIHLAAQRGHYQIVRLLASLSADEDRLGRSPLFMACDGASLRTIRVLLKFGSNINLYDDKGRTPLYTAASIGATDVVNLLLSSGADANAQDNAGIAPLHLAAFGGWRTVVTELIAANADVNRKNAKGQTALHFACKSPNPSLEVVQVLLENLADPDLEDSKGRSALHIAAQTGSVTIVDLLLKVGSSASRGYIKDNTDRTPLDLARRNKSRDVLDFLREAQLNTALNTDRISWSTGCRYGQDGIDIVFVHAFYNSSGSHAWLDDIPSSTGNMLKEDLENSRVIEWKYDSGILEQTSVENIYRIARSLLIDLGTLRASTLGDPSGNRPDKQPPIVFVGHGLSGLVIKAALVQAATDQNTQWRALLASTRAVVFISTPHYGTPRQPLGSLVGQLTVLSWQERGASDGFMTHRRFRKLFTQRWSQNSEALAALHRDFINSSRNIRILSMGGTRATGETILVPLESAYIEPATAQTAQNVAIDADHLTILRALSRNEPGYTVLLQLLIDVESETRPVQEHKESHNEITPGTTLVQPLTSYHLDILAALKGGSRDFDDTGDIEYDEIKSSLLPSRWNESPISNWIRRPHGRLLWITGKPGCGKSTVMKQLFRDKAFEQLVCESFPVFEGGLVKAAFAFGRTGKFQSTLEDMLRSLLYQILATKQELIPEILPSTEEIDYHRAKFWKAKTLHSALHRVIRASRGALCIFVDALDECRKAESQSFDQSPGEAQDDIARFLISLADLNSNVLVCVSSRALPMFSKYFRKATNIHLQDTNMSDIRAAVTSRIDQVDINAADASHIVNQIVKRCQGSFLWARLVTDMVMSGIWYGNSTVELEGKINSLPEELKTFYLNMLEAIPSTYRLEAEHTLWLMAASKRPIDAVTLSVAVESYRTLSNSLVTDAKVVFSDPPAMPANDRARRSQRIINVCGGLLEASEPGSIQFIHQTVLHFLSDPRLHQSLTSSSLPQDKALTPHMALLYGWIVLLKNYPDDHARTKQHITRAFESARKAAIESPEHAHFPQLFEELCKEASKLSQQQQNQSATESTGETHSASLSANDYALLLALRLGFTAYIEREFDQEPNNLLSDQVYFRASGPLLLALSFDKTLPWQEDISSLQDLPDPRAVRFLLSRGALKVLEAGYYCFSERYSRRSGPRPSAENRRRWIALFKYFLEAGAPPDATYHISLATAGRRADSTSLSIARDNVERQIITPEKSILDNLHNNSEFATDYDELLSLLNLRRKTNKMARRFIRAKLKRFSEVLYTPSSSES